MICLCFILYSIAGIAKQVRVELVSQVHHLEPGKIHTLVFRAHNLADDSVQMQLEATLPPDWTLAADMPEVALRAGETKIFLLLVHVPSTAAKGVHFMELTRVVRGQENVSERFELTVSHVQKITLKSISSTRYAKAGDTIRESFVLKNEGNHLETIQLEVSPDALIVGEAVRQLAAGEWQEVRVLQPTDRMQPRAQQKSIKLTAFLDSDSIQPVYVYARTDVIPTHPVDEDIYHRFLVQFSPMYIARERQGDFRGAWQGEIYGQGSLDEHHTRHLEFRAIGPDRFELTTFTPYDEYYATYRTPTLYAHIGDKVYSSSFLTEFARYGRGVELRKHLNKWEAGGFYNRPRFYKGIEDETHVYTRYHFSLQNSLQYGYLLKRMDPNGTHHHLHFMEGEARVLKNVHLKGEYARSAGASKTGYSWHLQATGTFRKADMHASYLEASPDFAGYYGNTHFFTGHINYRITPRLMVHTHVQQDARNFRRDTLLGAAPYREHVRLGLRYTYWKNATIGAYGGLQEFEDRNDYKQFHYEERFIRFDLNQQIQDWGINLQSYLAETRNHLTQHTGTSFIHSAHLNYRRRNTYFNVFGSYSELSRYQNSDAELFQYGGRINSRIHQQWDVSGFYQNAYHVEDYYADRNLFELAVQYQPSPSHAFKLVSRYALAQLQTERKDFSLMLRYTFSLRVPIKKVKEYGRLGGTIANYTSSDLTDLTLRLGHQTALVDPNGHFSFRNIPPGDYYLEIDPSGLGLRNISDRDMPARIAIQEGDNTYSFGITRSAALQGRIELTGEDRPLKSERIIVEMSSEHNTYRKIVAIHQPFDFTYLRPGDWTLRVYRNGLSSSYRILQEVFTFTLEPGEEKELVIEIERQQREIQYLQPPIRVGRAP